MTGESEPDLVLSQSLSVVTFLVKLITVLEKLCKKDFINLFLVWMI